MLKLVNGNIEFDIVLNRNYGGFGCCTEMALWLIENKGWTLIQHKDYDYKSKNKYPVTTIIDDKWNSYFLNNESMELRTHPDLIECLKTLKAQFNPDNDLRSHDCVYSKEIDDLEIMQVSVQLGVESYHDGHERLTCHASCNEYEY